MDKKFEHRMTEKPAIFQESGAANIFYYRLINLMFSSKSTMAKFSHQDQVKISRVCIIGQFPSNIVDIVTDGNSAKVIFFSL